MTKAKTASKNNPTSREKAREYTYNGKKVKPVLYIGVFVGRGKFMAASYEDGKLVKDAAGNVLKWKSISGSADTAGAA